MSGSDHVFVELAIDVKTRDPDRSEDLSLFDGRRAEVVGFETRVARDEPWKSWISFMRWNAFATFPKWFSPEDKSRREVWVTNQTRDLLNGQVEKVIRRWRRLKRKAEKAESWTSKNLKTVSSAITYFTNNRPSNVLR